MLDRTLFTRATVYSSATLVPVPAYGVATVAGIPWPGPATPFGVTMPMLVSSRSFTLLAIFMLYSYSNTTFIFRANKSGGRQYKEYSYLDTQFLHGAGRLFYCMKNSKGLLTERQRDFLRGGDAGGSNPRTIRQQIRERIQVGMEDLALLFNEIEQRDLEQLASADVQQFDDEFADSYTESIAFFIRMALVNSVPVSPLLQDSVYHGYKKESPSQIPIVNLHIESKNSEELLQQVRHKLRRNRPLSDEELRAVFENPLAIYDELDSIFRASVNPSSVEDFVQSNLDLIDPQLSLADGSIIKPDDGPNLIARDADNQIVLIEINIHNQPSNRDQIHSTVLSIADMVAEFGGEENARAILVTMGTSDIIKQEIDKYGFIQHVSLLDMAFS
jgi:hypothetical protein